MVTTVSGSNKGRTIDKFSNRDGGSKIRPQHVAAAVLGAGVMAFVAQNTQTTRLKWLFFSFEAPLWLMLLLTVVASVLIGNLLGWVSNRRKRHDG